MKSILLTLFFTLTFQSHPTHALRCTSWFTQLASSLFERYAPTPARRAFRSQINAINSAEKLTEFLAKKANANDENRSHVQALAEYLFSELELNEVRNIVRNLSLRHRHHAKQDIVQAYRNFVQGGFRSHHLRNLSQLSTDEKSFFRWNGLARKMRKNNKFIKKVRMAIHGYKSFKLVYTENIQVDQALASFLDGLELLDNPTLVGQLMEKFGQADPLTSQYIFDSIVKLKSTNNASIQVVLDEAVDVRVNQVECLIEAVIEKPSHQLQEEAYFTYTTSGPRHRPELPKQDTTKLAAFRFLKRNDYVFYRPGNAHDNNDIEFTTDTLLNWPTYDEAIDSALRQLLESADDEYFDSDTLYLTAYGRLELKVLARKAKMLGRIELDLRYALKILSGSIQTRSKFYLAEIIRLHQEHNLNNFPYLRQLVVNYFNKFPGSLRDLEHLEDLNIPPFRREFGL